VGPVRDQGHKEIPSIPSIPSIKRGAGSSKTLLHLQPVRSAQCNDSKPLLCSNQTLGTLLTGQGVCHIFRSFISHSLNPFQYLYNFKSREGKQQRIP
jgi:hypothetical protein